MHLWSPFLLPAAQARLMAQGAQIAAHSQAIIAMRIAGMLGMMAQHPGEPLRMVAEKQSAAIESMSAITSALIKGHGTERLMNAALKPYATRTAANAKRLQAAQHRNERTSGRYTT